jgi:hypothetical protein
VQDSSAYKDLVEKSKGKGPSGGSRHRQEVMNVDVNQIKWKCRMDSSNSGKRPCEQSNEPYSFIKCRKSLD